MSTPRELLGLLALVRRLLLTVKGKTASALSLHTMRKIEVVDSQIGKLKTKRREGMISDDKYEKQMETLRNKKQRIRRNQKQSIEWISIVWCMLSGGI